VFAFLTGATGSVAIDHLKLVKDSTSWNANLLVPDFTFGSNHMDSIAFDLSSMGEILEGKLEISRLSNASISLEGITAILRYSDHCYGFDLENSYSELIGANHISLLAQEVDGGYKLSFNESDPLVIKDESWSLTKNQGLAIDKNFKLLEGDLAISNGPSTLEAMTENHIVRLMIDSLNLDPWFAYLTREDLISGQLNGEIELNTLDRITQWDADIVASNEWVPEPVFVAISGKMSQDGFSAHLDISQDDLSAQANVRKTGDEVDYAAVLNRVDLGLLHLLPAWPGDFDVSGRISGKAWGSIGTTISNRGYLVTEEVVLKPPLTYSPIRLEHDTLMLKDSLILLKDFRIKDYLDEELLVAGSLQYSPDLKFDLSLKSEQFALLQSGENESQIQGELNLSADLHLEGGREEVLISGQLSTLPGAKIKYTTQATFNLVDASQVVTFMELDAEDSEHKEVPSEKSKAGTKLNWDVNLLVNPASIEIMLDEISQEFIQINSEGQLSIRSGFDEKPMVYGSIASTSGRAFIRPPAIPEVDLIIDNALIKWNGLVDDPTMSFRGYKIVKGPTGGLSPQFENRSEFINYKVYVVLDRVRLSDFNLRFDLEAEDSEAEILLASLPADTRQAYALNMLLFGKVGTDKISGKAMVADQVTTKLNELARRNFKNTGLSFSSSYYKNAKDGVVERSHTDLNYALSRGFLNNKLSFSVMGSVGFYMDDLTMLPPSNLIGDVELRYILSEKPKLTLKGARENVYEGIIDGMVTEESVGLIYQKSYPTFIDLFRKNKINLAK